MAQKNQNEIKVKGGVVIMPHAAKPSLAGRPKPAPRPRSKKQA